MKMKSKYRLLILLPAFCFLCFHLFPRQPDSGFWWQVAFKIYVSGQYHFQANNKGFDGSYSFTAVLLGTLEEDEGDFIFLQAYQNISDAKWKEVTYNQNNRSEQILTGKIKPEVTLNYVFREKGETSFDFDFQPIPVPYKNPLFPEPVYRLCLPQSAAEETINSRAEYREGIIDGSSRIAMADNVLYDKKENEVNRVFKWKWQKKKDASWNSSHDVEVKLKIIRLKKK